MVEGTLKASSNDDVATEGKVAVVRYKSRWPKEDLDGLTEEARSGRGFPPHRMEFSHMLGAPSSSAALARKDVTRNVEGIRLPDTPEKIADWCRAVLGNRGSVEQEDDEGAYRAAFKDHIGKSQMGV